MSDRTSLTRAPRHPWRKRAGPTRARVARRGAPFVVLVLPAAWVLVEWWRGWFLTGFPWLSLGYSQTDTWLAGLAPVGGVPLVSLSLLAGAGALLVLAQERGAARAVAPPMTAIL